MRRTVSISERLARRLADVVQSRSGAIGTEVAMAQLDRERQAFEQQAEPLHRRIIRPLLEQLVAGFPGAGVEHFRTPNGFVSEGRFGRTPELPAPIRLRVAVVRQPIGQGAWLVVDVQGQSVPLGIEVTDRCRVPSGPAAAAACWDWVEQKLLEFVDAYTQLESMGAIRGAAVYTDRVCGMQVWGDAALRVEHDGKTFYFCSHACMTRFQADPRTYIAASRPVG